MRTIPIPPEILTWAKSVSDSITSTKSDTKETEEKDMQSLLTAILDAKTKVLIVTNKEKVLPIGNLL
jgi:hypothetical protein